MLQLNKVLVGCRYTVDQQLTSSISELFFVFKIMIFLKKIYKEHWKAFHFTASGSWLIEVEENVLNLWAKFRGASVEDRLQE